MRFGKELVVLLVVLLVLPLVAGELSVSSSQSLVNVGDVLNVSVTISPAVPVTDYVRASLVCGVSEIEFFKSAYGLRSGEVIRLPLSLSLDPAIIGDARGECRVGVRYGEDEVYGPLFVISSLIHTQLELRPSMVDPGEAVIVMGKATKENGAVVEGYASVRVEGIGIEHLFSVVHGAFNGSMVIPSKAKHGSYVVSAYVYQKSASGSVLNEGSSSSSLRVNQIPASISIALSKDSFIPGDDVSFSVLVYDQAGEEAALEVPVSIKNPDGSISLQQLASGDEPVVFPTETSTVPGTWTIEAHVLGLEAHRSFVIEPLMDAVFILENNSVLIRNVGNVPFQKAVSFSIGDTKEIQELSIPVGDTKRVGLSAPKGEYPIAVDMGEGEQVLGTTFLTGRAISLSTFNELVSGGSFVWIVWSFLLALLALLLFFYYRKVKKNAFIGVKPSEKESIKVTSVGSLPLRESTTEKKLSSVVAVQLRELPDAGRSAVEKGLLRAKAAGGHIYVDDTFRIIVFTPEVENAVSVAISVANEISSELTVYNGNASQRVVYGVGVHEGELILDRSSGKLRFSSWGNTLPFVKNMAVQSDNEIFISEGVRAKALGKVKAQQVEGKNMWRVSSVVQRDKHQAFIKNFTDRQFTGSKSSASK
ncbi:MAG TPA: hypothetical protein VJK51_00870 [Candidatus Nanoarchaeia archaeon]|nr:hypothetical protein [Candidatus Nanoarchaeia archaeon]